MRSSFGNSIDTCEGSLVFSSNGGEGHQWNASSLFSVVLCRDGPLGRRGRARDDDRDDEADALKVGRIGVGRE